MNDQAQRRAQKLRQALRENLKRRKANAAPGADEATVRREDRLEPRLRVERPEEEDATGGD